MQRSLWLWQEKIDTKSVLKLGRESLIELINQGIWKRKVKLRSFYSKWQLLSLRMIWFPQILSVSVSQLLQKFFSAKVFYRSMHRNKQTNKKLIIKHPFLNKTLAIIVSLVAWCYVLSLSCLKLRILKRKVDSNGSWFSWHFFALKNFNDAIQNRFYDGVPGLGIQGSVVQV